MDKIYEQLDRLVDVRPEFNYKIEGFSLIKELTINRGFKKVANFRIDNEATKSDALAFISRCIKLGDANR